jgi:hypothetical protein
VYHKILPKYGHAIQKRLYQYDLKYAPALKFEQKFLVYHFEIGKGEHSTELQSVKALAVSAIPGWRNAHLRLSLPSFIQDHLDPSAATTNTTFSCQFWVSV